MALIYTYREYYTNTPLWGSVIHTTNHNVVQFKIISIITLIKDSGIYNMKAIVVKDGIDSQ